MHTYTYTHKHIYTHTYAYIYTPIHKHTHTQLPCCSKEKECYWEVSDFVTKLPGQGGTEATARGVSVAPTPRQHLPTFF